MIEGVESQMIKFSKVSVFAVVVPIFYHLLPSFFFEVSQSPQKFRAQMLILAQLLCCGLVYLVHISAFVTLLWDAG